jgi:NADPH-dependent curcumin reductase CurA
MRNDNRRILLASRPTGRPTPANFRLVSAPIPAPAEGEVLTRTVWLSLAPYMFWRMRPEKSYAPPVPLDGVMVGATVGRVIASRHPDFAPGDVVLGGGGWQDFAVQPGEALQKIDPGDGPPSLALNLLGGNGLTAYAGLLDIGRPKSGETVVVAAASGGVGSIVGQIARIKGARAVGIAGGAAKCAYVTGELGFDACLDHRAPDFPARLAEACPQGIDVYFENVGGAVWEAVFPLLNDFARVPVCGLIAQYTETGPPPGPDRLPELMRAVLSKRLTLRGYISSDYAAMRGEAMGALRGWLREGRLRYREDVTDGLEHAPEALIAMLDGRNFGKVLVRVAAEDA